MRIAPVGSPAWRARQLVAATPVDPVEPVDLSPILPRRSFPGDAMPWPGPRQGPRQGRRRPSPDDAPHRPGTIDVREGRVLPEMTAEQFEAFRRSDHGTGRLDPPHGHAYGSRLVIDLTDSPSTIDLRA